MLFGLVNCRFMPEQFYAKNNVLKWHLASGSPSVIERPSFLLFISTACETEHSCRGCKGRVVNISNYIKYLNKRFI